MLDPKRLAPFEGRIAVWRGDLEAKRLGRRVLDELEDHLLSCLENELEVDGDPERAWGRCLERFGPVEELAREFSKLSRPSRFEKATLVGVAASGTVIGVALTAHECEALMRITRDPWLTGHVAAVLFGYILALTLGTLGSLFAAVRLGSRLVHRGDPPVLHVVDSRRLSRTILRASVVIALACGIGGALGSFSVLPQLGRGWSWDPREVGVVVVALFHVALAWVTARTPDEHELHTSLAAAAGSLTLLAWFGVHGWVAGGFFEGGSLILAVCVPLSAGLGLALLVSSKRARGFAQGSST